MIQEAGPARRAEPGLPPTPLFPKPAKPGMMAPTMQAEVPVKIPTRSLNDSPTALFIKSSLASRHMGCEGKELRQGGRRGFGHQFDGAREALRAG